MPRIRAEQLQGLTLTNDQIGDGYTYDRNGVQIADFDPSRLIDQSKIKDTEFNPNGWISRGLINRVEVLPEWQADYEGRLFYVNTSDQLYLAVGTEPWYILITGDTAGGWDAELTVRTGLDGTDWNGTMATTFQTLSYTFSPDGSDLFVYLNGSLQRLDHDFTIQDQRTIRLTRNAGQNDTITMLVILSNSMLNYATKAWVFDAIQSGGLQHSLDAAYDDGSIVSVDSRDVDFRLATDKKFLVTESITGVPLPATHVGTENVFNGHDWQTRWQCFDVVSRIGGTTVGPHRVYLNSPAVNIGEVATEISEGLVSAGITDLFGFQDDQFVGIQSTAVGSDISFDLYSGTNLLPIVGLNSGSSQGDDAYSSYHELGLSVTPSDPAGLEDNEKFWFSINGAEYSINTGAGTTYDQLRSLMDGVADAAGFTVTTEVDDIRVTRDQAGLAYPTTLAGVSYAGQIEITQVTTVADADRSLSEKYFELSSIDSSLFGHEKEYYTWYHLDAEAEQTEIVFTAENSNVTLANKYFDIHTPSEDFYVWFEVETPQTAGYQELGLTGTDSSTSTGLTQAQTYSFNVAVDGASPTSMNVTMPPDIQPVNEITEVTTVADTSQSLSGKYWTLNSQTGAGFYVWYNINTPAAPEITEITAVADVNQSLSGKSFTLFAPGTQYYAWLRMMTDPGLPELAEITQVTATSDISQSLSGKYFTLDSADGSQYYVWYEMMTDPGVTATTEITEVETVADAGQSLSGKYFEFSSPETDYYAWYRMEVTPPVTGEAEVTDVIIPGDNAKSLSGKYWTFNTPYNDYYVWYRMIDTPSIPASAEETTFTFNSGAPVDYDGDSLTFYHFNDQHNVVLSNGLRDDFEVDADSWINANVAETEFLHTGNGTVTIEALDIDPQVKKEGLSIDGATHTIVRARVKRLVGSAGLNYQLFYKTGSHTYESYYFKSAVDPNANLNEWSIIEFDMTSLNAGGTDWTDETITGIRLDIPQETSHKVEIDWIEVVPDTSTKSNPVVAYIEDASVASDISAAVTNAITAASIPFTAVDGSGSVVITCNNVGSQTNAPTVSDATNMSVAVTSPGTDFVAAIYSTNPAPADKTGVQVNITENDTNTTVASLTNAQLALLGDITTVVNGATITITNDDNGAVADAADVDAGAVPTVTNQGITSAPATYSTNPMVAGRTGVVVDVALNDSADTVASLTAGVINGMSQLTASASTNVVTIETITVGAVADATAGDSGFTVNVTQPGLDYVAPTYSANPAPSGRSAIKVSINEDEVAVNVAEFTRAAIDAVRSFTATRANAVITITDLTTGPVTDAADVNTGFTISASQQGQDYVAPTYTSNPGGTGNGIQVDISENDTATAVAQALEVALGGVTDFIISRADDTVTVECANAGANTDSVDIDSGFTFNITQDGYEAYSSTDPAVVGKTGLQVTINENETAALVAAKTQVVVNANALFTASVSDNVITITDENGGDVADAADGDAGVSVNVTQPGVDLIPADVSWGNVINLLNAATTVPATWSITNGDVRLTSDTIGSWTSVDISGGDLATALGAPLDAIVNGTSSYSSQPVGTGTPIKAPILVGSTAPEVAAAVYYEIQAGDYRGVLLPSIGIDVGVDDHIVTLINGEAGAVADVADHGTLFTFNILNQGANESVDPAIAGKTGIQVNINKNDDADSVAIATQSAIDLGGEFYVTRLNNIVSIQNDYPGSVTPSSDVNTGFVFTQTGIGVDVKNNLFGVNGLNTTLPAPVAGIDAIPASTGVGTESLTGGYNFYTFPKDFAVIINGEPIVEIFLDQACFNSSEVVSHINTAIANAGVTNLEAYQVSGQVGLRTIQTGLSQTLELKDSLSDALVTLGWTAGTYTGDYGEADAIFSVTALSGQNQIDVDADILPVSLGAHNIGSMEKKFKEIWAQEAHFDEGTIYIGDNTISVTDDEFSFTVEDGVNTYDFFGNIDTAIAPVGADRIGVAGVTGVIPEKDGAQPGDPGSLQEMLTGFAKSAGGGKLFPDMSSTGAVYGDPTNLKGFLSEKANGLYLKLNEVVMIESVNREIRVLTQGPGIVEGVDWIWRNTATDAIGGDSYMFDLTEMDANGEPTTGTLPSDSFYVKTTGGIKLETGASNMVHVTNDLQIDGDLIVQGDTVTMNVSELSVEDNIVLLNKNVSGTPALDAGIEVERGTSTNTRIMWDESTDTWRAGLNSAEKAMAMRDEVGDMVNQGMAIWNSSTLQFGTTDVTATEFIQDTIGAMVGGNTEAGISVVYQDADGTLDFNVNDPTITLTGAVTGSATMTNLGNVTINTTATNDPTLTLNGDVSGSATFTNLGNATLTVTVANDSHTHDTRYYTETESNNRFVNVTGDSMTGRLTINQTTGGLAAAKIIKNVDDASNTPALIVASDGEATDVIAEFRANGSATVVDQADAANSADAKVRILGTGNMIGVAAGEISGFGKVYNAVWNDIADFIEVEESCVVEYGKCYFIDKDFTHKQTSGVCQKGVLGIASDTYGYGLGKDEDKHQLPIAVGGFVLAYIDGEVEPGDVLTAGPNGNLVVMSVEDKAAYPERIVATYYKPEPNDEYHGIKVNGRHWVKVK